MCRDSTCLPRKRATEGNPPVGSSCSSTKSRKDPRNSDSVMEEHREVVFSTVGCLGLAPVEALCPPPALHTSPCYLWNLQGSVVGSHYFRQSLDVFMQNPEKYPEFTRKCTFLETEHANSHTCIYQNKVSYSLLDIVTLWLRLS